MSNADQFRQYAEGNLRWARRSTTEKEKMGAARTSQSLDAVGGAERGYCDRYVQSARAPRPVTPASVGSLAFGAGCPFPFDEWAGPRAAISRVLLLAIEDALPPVRFPPRQAVGVAWRRFLRDGRRDGGEASRTRVLVR
jgi:hypothetical protein